MWGVSVVVNIENVAVVKIIEQTATFNLNEGRDASNFELKVIGGMANFRNLLAFSFVRRIGIWGVVVFASWMRLSRSLVTSNSRYARKVMSEIMLAITEIARGYVMLTSPQLWSFWGKVR